MHTSFENILFEIYTRRKVYFDKTLKQLLTPHDDCLEIVFEEEEDDEFTTLLDHFVAIVNLR
jgi:hypothetical protein